MEAERAIRNAIVDILCFLSHGKPTDAQVTEIEKRISLAADVVRECQVEEDART